jgi:hypothetical protein
MGVELSVAKAPLPNLLGALLQQQQQQEEGQQQELQQQQASQLQLAEAC